MIELRADRITLQVTLTKDDYASYFAAVSRRDSNWTNLACWVGAFFAAIPVALVFKSIGLHLSNAPADAELIGKFSLFAFLLGAVTMIAAGSITHSLASRKFLAGTLNAFEPKTIVLDATGVTTTGKISQTSWHWAAISQLTARKGRLLMWIGRVAVVIPDRAFASAEARDAAIAFARARMSQAESASSPPAA